MAKFDIAMRSKQLINKSKEELLVWSLRKLYFVMLQVKDCFYQEHNFLLTTDLTQLGGKYKDSLIYIPEEIFELLKEFDWDKVDFKYDQTWVDNEFKDIFPLKVIDLISSDLHCIKVNFSEEEISQLVFEICKFYKVEKLQVSVHPDLIGSIVTYNPKTGALLARADADLFNIAYAIVGKISLKDLASYSWESFDLIKRFMASKFDSSKSLGRLERASKTSLKGYADLKKISNDNYRELGFPARSLFKIEINNILYNGLKTDEFTYLEARVLKELIKNSGQIISYDRLSDLMGQNIENFSMQSMAKLIERIRKKTKKLGCRTEVIFTKNSEGYFWSE